MRPLKKLNLFLQSIFCIFLLCSCQDQILSKEYVGVLSDKTEDQLSTGSNVELKGYEKFIFTTSEKAELKSETIMLIEFNFYSDISTNVSIHFLWEYTTTIFNIKHTADFGKIEFLSSGSGVKNPQMLSYELEEKDYFVIKNNKVQKLILEISYEGTLNCFVNVPDIMTLVDDDENSLEDEWDKEVEEELPYE